MNAIITMVESASVIIVAIMFLAFVGERLERSFWRHSLAFGGMFAVIGLVVMSTPVELIPGVRTDPRNAVVTLSAAFGGPVSAVLTAIPMVLLRLHFGGIGAVPGALSIAAAALSSSAIWYWWRQRRGLDPSQLYLFCQALSVAIVPTLVIYLTTSAPTEIYLRAASLFVPVNFATVLLMGNLVLREYQRRWAVAAHADAQARLQATANDAPGMLFQVELMGENTLLFHYVSNGAYRILGVDPERFMDEPETLARLISEEEMSRLFTLMSDSAQSHEPWAFETKCVHPRGDILWVRAVARLHPSEDDAAIWDGFLYDITEQKRSEQMKNDFIATVSHELRTPLTSIHGALSLMDMGRAGELTVKGKRLVSMAHANSDRLVRLINDILDIERIESGAMPFDIRPTALRSVIDGALEATRSYSAERNTKIVVEDTAPNLTAMVDPDRLNQVLVNLISNAVKFSPPERKVSIRIAQRSGRARIYVSDEGPGIPPEFRSRIFNKFERADASDTQKVGGTGLGLSISKAIVEHLNGEIDFESVEKEGTTFCIDLPALPMETASSSRAKSLPDPGAYDVGADGDDEIASL
ncbi:PAS domain S-box-containing protein [Rhodobium orientis]|uniref:histidine kinase n=1 Tax=Rhodobium orientis TaxID=34017 RepID=A0A327JNI9_9HYPH|nr:ATP-binding protein [Rhodobium orientis]MBB4303174.1 PAS domain S-box-containing protein [Rhodobium orientis]RAI26904.1 hypothetical protein CH339_11995 [Rhodobium orientis]